MQSQLDYMLPSFSLTYLISNTKISPGNSSDHSIVLLSIDIAENAKRGKGFWKFNNDLLIDRECVSLINETISNRKTTVNMADKIQLWEYVNCQIITDTILYSSKKAKANRKVELDLKEKLQAFEQKLSATDNKEDLEYCEYRRIKSKWENHILRKNNGIIRRSKAKWVEEEGEKNTKYFLKPRNN